MAFLRSVRVIRRFLHKSTKSRDDVVSWTPGLMEKQPKGPETVKEFADVDSQKNWISFGFDYGNKREDRYLLRVLFVTGVTMMMVGGAYIVAYFPDVKLNDWVIRESFLELNRRQRMGLPLVSRDLIDPNLIQLPPESELTDVDIHL